MRRSIRPLAAWLGVFALAAPLSADVPAWLKSAAALPTPAYAESAPAVVLVDDSQLEIDAAGVLTETRHYAVRVLHSSGRKFASDQVFYNGVSDKVDNLGAWVVRGGKEFEGKSSSQWLDASAASTGAVIDEVRRRAIDLSERVLVNDVFGCETQVHFPLVVAHLPVMFGGLLPKLQSTCTLTLPSGFSLTTLASGPAKVVAAHPDTRHWSWTVSAQAYRPEESHDAGAGRIDADLLLQVVPSAEAAGKFKPGRFARWADVTAMSDALNRPQCDSNPALVALARSLAAGGADDRLATIQRIGAQVQSLRYIAINRGLRYGYGWRARKATEVLSAGFGDCKDKANLMVAMLREAGIPAYMVLARLDRDRPVRNDFPSPIQFNHAIVAIPVGQEVVLPTVVSTPGLGRALFFDPTDPFTPVGDISGELQGGSVLVLAPQVDRLVELPEFPPGQDFRTERLVELTLAPNGSLALSGRIVGRRQAGAGMRAAFKQATQPADIDKLVVRQLGARLKNATILERKMSDDRAADRCELSFNGELPGYMQLSASATPVVRLDVLGRSHIPNLTETTRHLPVELHPLEMSDEIKLSLPPGYGVAEVPAKVSLSSAYGHFSVEYFVESGVVRMKRSFALERNIVPLADYGQLKQFLADVARADRSSILLQREAVAAGTASTTPVH